METSLGSSQPSTMPSSTRRLDVTFTGNNVGQIQLCKLDLLAAGYSNSHSFTTQSYSGLMILELQRTDGMSHTLDGILDGMSKVIHRINAPGITGTVMMSYGLHDR